MRRGWINSITGGFTVEHLPCPNPGQLVDVDAPAKGLLHTTEGSLESALNVFLRHFAPTFTVGQDRKGRVRILQHVPLGRMAAALENHRGGVETNRVCRVQIEIAAFSEHRLWQPSPQVAAALAALMHALSNLEEIPLRHPAVLRDPTMWVRAAGWVGHIDAPENTHWDPGAFDYARLFKLAAAVPNAKRPKVKLRAKPKRYRPRTILLKRAAKRAAPAPLCPRMRRPE